MMKRFCRTTTAAPPKTLRLSSQNQTETRTIKEKTKSIHLGQNSNYHQQHHQQPCLHLHSPSSSSSSCASSSSLIHVTQTQSPTGPYLSDEQMSKIQSLVREIEQLSDVEKLLLYLQLPGGSPSESEVARNRAKGGSGSSNPFGKKADREITQTYTWILSHLEEDSNVSLPKQEVYDEYRAFCMAHTFEPLCVADFGKAMKHAFPRVKPRRLGQRGNSRYCYSGLRKKIRIQAPTLPDIGSNACPSPPSSCGGSAGYSGIQSTISMDQVHSNDHQERNSNVIDGLSSNVVIASSGEDFSSRMSLAGGSNPGSSVSSPLSNQTSINAINSKGNFMSPTNAHQMINDSYIDSVRSNDNDDFTMKQQSTIAVDNYIDSHSNDSTCDFAISQNHHMFSMGLQPIIADTNRNNLYQNDQDQSENLSFHGQAHSFKRRKRSNSLSHFSSSNQIGSLTDTESVLSIVKRSSDDDSLMTFQDPNQGQLNQNHHRILGQGHLNHNRIQDQVQNGPAVEARQQQAISMDQLDNIEPTFCMSNDCSHSVSQIIRMSNQRLVFNNKQRQTEMSNPGHQSIIQRSSTIMQQVNSNATSSYIEQTVSCNSPDPPVSVVSQENSSINQIGTIHHNTPSASSNSTTPLNLNGGIATNVSISNPTESTSVTTSLARPQQRQIFRQPAFTDPRLSHHLSQMGSLGSPIGYSTNQFENSIQGNNLGSSANSPNDTRIYNTNQQYLSDNNNVYQQHPDDGIAVISYAAHNVDVVAPMQQQEQFQPRQSQFQPRHPFQFHHGEDHHINSMCSPFVSPRSSPNSFLSSNTTYHSHTQDSYNNTNMSNLMIDGMNNLSNHTHVHTGSHLLMRAPHNTSIHNTSATTTPIASNYDD